MRSVIATNSARAIGNLRARRGYTLRVGAPGKRGEPLRSLAGITPFHDRHGKPEAAALAATKL